MKKIIILAIAIVFATNTFAGRDTSRERVNDWLQNDRVQQQHRGAINDDEDTEDELGLPVGDGLLILSLLAIGYAAVSKIRKPKHTDIL